MADWGLLGAACAPGSLGKSILPLAACLFESNKKPPAQPNLIKISNSPDRQLDDLGCIANT